MDNFTIEIVDPHWIDRDPANETDECSHGRFLLTLGGVTILSYEDDIDDWTTSTSVLRLLRTLENDFVEDRGFGILLHCGMLPMISCPISVDWALVHSDGKVFINDIKKCLSTDDSKAISFDGLAVAVDFQNYRTQVVGVANQVKEFFDRSRPRKLTGADVQLYNDFWKEFNALLSRYA